MLMFREGSDSHHLNLAWIIVAKSVIIYMHSISCNSCFFDLHHSSCVVAGKSSSTLRIEMTAWFIIQLLGLLKVRLINQWVPQWLHYKAWNVHCKLIESKGRFVGSGSTPSNLRPSNVVYHWQATFKGNYLLVYSPDGVFRMCVRTLTCPKDSQRLQHGLFFLWGWLSSLFFFSSPRWRWIKQQWPVAQCGTAQRTRQHCSIGGCERFHHNLSTSNCFPCLFPSSGAKVQNTWIYKWSQMVLFLVLYPYGW